MNMEKEVGNVPEDLDGIDRREALRKKINIKRTFQVILEVEGEEKKNCFMHIVDMSERGIRVHCDFPFPENKNFRMKFFLEKPVEFSGQLVWQKPLLGGIYVIGIQFTDISETDRNAINEFVERYSLEGRRKTFRLNRVLAVELEIGDKMEKFYALTVDLNEHGMRISHETPLPENITLKFRLILYYVGPPVEVNAKVVWQKETAWGDYMMGIQFIDVLPEAKQAIRNYIDDVILGNIPNDPMGMS